VRRAGEGDLPAIRAFLGAEPELAMFPLSNLARYGLDGEAPYSVSFWIAEGPEGVTDVLTVTRMGMVMPRLPSGRFTEAAAAIAGREVGGVIGPATEARGVMAAAGLVGVPATLDMDEPQFALALDDLALPEGPGTLVPIGEIGRETFVRWRTDYHIEALGEQPTQASIGADKEFDAYIARDSHRALIVDGQPVAMTGFNASLPEIVQIGGVYTPPDLRGRGHARRALALHLHEAREAGVRRATLFTGSDMAARAYRAVGFREVGHWTLALFKEPARVDG
jgi:RimJ/RimL family protein N-acetyltransferase